MQMQVNAVVLVWMLSTRHNFENIAQCQKRSVLPGRGASRVHPRIHFHSTDRPPGLAVVIEDVRVFFGVSKEEGHRKGLNRITTVETLI